MESVLPLLLHRLADGVYIKLYVKGYCPHMRSVGAKPAMAVVMGDQQPKHMKVAVNKKAAIHGDHAFPLTELLETALLPLMGSLSAAGTFLSLGITLEKGKLKVAEGTETYLALTRGPNDVVNDYTPDYRWNGIGIYVGEATTHPPIVQCDGPSLAMMFGDFSGGAYKNQKGGLRA